MFIRLQIVSSGGDLEEVENSLRSMKTHDTNNEIHKIVVNRLPRQAKTEANKYVIIKKGHKKTSPRLALSRRFVSFIRSWWQENEIA